MAGKSVILPLGKNGESLLWHNQRLFERYAVEILDDGRQRTLFKCKTNGCSASAEQVEPLEDSEEFGEVGGEC